MAMMTGSSRNSVGAINVTPLIDILLVLLIIFMVITPVGLEAQAPQPAPDHATSTPDPGTIVVQIDRELRITINTEAVAADEFATRLRDIFKTRATKLVFLKAAPDLEFQQVARTIDTIKGAGVDRIGLLGKNS